MLNRFALIFMVSWVYSGHTAELQWQPYDLRGPQAQIARGEVAYIEVPENRKANNSSKIRLGFVKLPGTAAKPGNPIVYLSGGPGGSATWTASGPRFPMFVALTELADVIVFDQRGTGLSRNNLEDCVHEPVIPLHQALDRKSFWRNSHAAISYCAKQWRQAGIDLDGYNTVQSAHDLEALRLALGAEKLDLWAISYGTHLAFAMAKLYPNSIGRMVLASAEGPDQTIKLPGRADAQLQRIVEEIALDEQAKSRYPDLMGLMKNVIDQYRKEPQIINVKNPQTGESVRVGVGDLEIQILTAGALTRDPELIAELPGFYTLLANGKFSMIGGHFLDYRTGMWTFNPMSLAMDAASGISRGRWRQVRNEAGSSVLWRAHNLPFPDINKTLGVADLGDEFRKNPNSDIPALFLSGDLDGRTFIESHRELASGFKNHTFVTIHRAGHNLFMSSPEVLDTMIRFYTGEKIKDFTIDLPPITFK